MDKNLKRLNEALRKATNRAKAHGVEYSPRKGDVASDRSRAVGIMASEYRQAVEEAFGGRACDEVLGGYDLEDEMMSGLSGTALFDAICSHVVPEFLESHSSKGLKESLDPKKTLKENAPNFDDQSPFPLLVFHEYSDVLSDPDYPSEDAYEGPDGDIDYDAYGDAVSQFERERYGGAVILDDGQVSDLKDDLVDFNYKAREKAGELECDAPEVGIKPGYYSAYQVHLGGRLKGLPNEMVDLYVSFAKELKRKYGLTELRTAWRANNGEAGYEYAESAHRKDPNPKKTLKEGYLGQTVSDFLDECGEDSTIERVVVYALDSEDPVYDGNRYDIPYPILESPFMEFDSGGAKLTVNVREDCFGSMYDSLGDFLEDCNSEEISVYDVDSGETVYDGYKEDIGEELLEKGFCSFDGPAFLSINIDCNKGDLFGEVDESLEEYYRIEYWVDEEAREEGLGEFLLDEYSELALAKETARKMVDRDGVASVEVQDASGRPVWGYDGVEVWTESKDGRKRRKNAHMRLNVGNPEANRAFFNMAMGASDYASGDCCGGESEGADAGDGGLGESKDGGCGKTVVRKFRKAKKAVKEKLDYGRLYDEAKKLFGRMPRSLFVDYVLGHEDITDMGEVERGVDDFAKSNPDKKFAREGDYLMDESKASDAREKAIRRAFRLIKRKGCYAVIYAYTQGSGTVFLNPPLCKDNQEEVQKFVDAFKRGKEGTKVVVDVLYKSQIDDMDAPEELLGEDTRKLKSGKTIAKAFKGKGGRKVNEMTDDELRSMPDGLEKRCINMLNSMIAYDWDRKETAKEFLDRIEGTHTYKYIEKYIDELGKDKVAELMQRQIDDVDRIVYAATDSDGLDYNSIIWKDSKCESLKPRRLAEGEAMGKANEDTEKLKDGEWANVGKDGKADSGTFKTKKQADAQRKAMFANGYKAESLDGNVIYEFPADEITEEDLEAMREYGLIPLGKSGEGRGEENIAVFGQEENLRDYCDHWIGSYEPAKEYLVDPEYFVADFYDEADLDKYDEVVFGIGECVSSDSSDSKSDNKNESASKPKGPKLDSEGIQYFGTKKKADAQRKAIFANGLGESYEDDVKAAGKTGANRAIDQYLYNHFGSDGVKAMHDYAKTYKEIWDIIHDSNKFDDFKAYLSAKSESANNVREAKKNISKLDTSGVQYFGTKNQFNYDKKQLRIDHDAKTYETGLFTHIAKRQTVSSPELNRIINRLDDMGYKETKKANESASNAGADREALFELAKQVLDHANNDMGFNFDEFGDLFHEACDYYGLDDDAPENNEYKNRLEIAASFLMDSDGHYGIKTYDDWARFIKGTFDLDVDGEREIYEKFMSMLDKAYGKGKRNEGLRKKSVDGKCSSEYNILDKGGFVERMKKRKSYERECGRVLEKYASVNDDGFAEGLGNAYSARRHLYGMIDVGNDKGRVVLEKIDFEVPPEELGGIIVLSTDVNASKMSGNRFVNWLKQKIKTFSNRFNADKKVNGLLKGAEGVQGWTVGKFLRGRYVGKNGQVFDENSLSVEIVGIKLDKLLAVAEDLCKEFDQETVLVKTYSPMRVLFVNSERE